VGDLNAEPGSPEILLLEEFGLAEVIKSAGITPGYTYSSLEPVRRIDYIWLSADLQAENVSITTEPASDHLGIAATVE
jgi:endonuclease/exonuclease/phosphatase family metal-dependent hydrolase